MFLLAVLPVIILVMVLGLLAWYQNHSRFFKHINKIPGPASVPVLGNFLDFAVTPEKIMTNLREKSVKYFPIYKESLVHHAAVTLMEPDDLEIVLSGNAHTKKSRLYDILHKWLGTGLLTSDGDKWRTRRKMLTPAFHFSILQNFVEIFNEETVILVNNLKQRLNEPVIDVVPPITEFTLKSMAETSMGISLDLNDETTKNYKNTILNLTRILLHRMFRPWCYDERVFRFHWKSFAMNKFLKKLHDFTTGVINERKKTFSLVNDGTRKRLAMLDLLLTVKEKHGTIDDDGIREEVDTFMFEGHDTTSVAITYTLMTLANHKEIQEEARQEILDIIGESNDAPSYTELQRLSYTERCVKECLRLFPPVHFMARDATTDFITATGYMVPKGAMIHIHPFDVHRNPTIYPDPEKFDPDRFLPENTQKRHPYAYIPFSAGPRNCIGQKFAMLELKSVLCGILRNFILEPVDKAEDIIYIPDVVLRSKNNIRVKFVPRTK